MALYDYRCGDCTHTQEESHGMRESPQFQCDACLSLNMSKVILQVAPVHFRGGGWTFGDETKKFDTIKGRPRTKYGDKRVDAASRKVILDPQKLDEGAGK